MIVIEKHHGINVLRDDLLPGGTKSILMPSIISDDNEYVYASPVYGGFQIALSAFCQKENKKVTIFCAKRKVMHSNTLECISLGAKIIEIEHGYLSVVEKKAREYCEKTGAKKLVFGANTEENKILISNRVKKVIDIIGEEPDEIWCAVGSGTLVESIILGTTKSKIYGVQVGKNNELKHERLRLLKHPLPFDKESKFKVDFKSTKNYDLKAFEMCVKRRISENVLFWNVL